MSPFTWLVPEEATGHLRSQHRFPTWPLGGDRSWKMGWIIWVSHGLGDIQGTGMSGMSPRQECSRYFKAAGRGS